jgi:hypothetical protein
VFRLLIDIVSLHFKTSYDGYVYGACSPSGMPSAQ